MMAEIAARSDRERIWIGRIERRVVRSGVDVEQLGDAPAGADLEDVTDASALELEERALVVREGDAGDDDAVVLRRSHRDLHALGGTHAHEETARIVERELARARRIARGHRDDDAGLGHVVGEDLVVREPRRAARGKDLGHREDRLLHGRGRDRTEG